MNNMPPKDRDIAMVFQSYALYPNMTIEENITFGMKMRRMPVAERATKTAEVAKLLQIEPLLDRKPAQLSGGQRQRVAMGRALVRDPKLFLFDEPLSNLDAKLRVEMRTEIRRVHKVLGASTVYVTHDQIEALTMATRIAVLKDGVVQQVDSPSEIYNSPANTFVADFMGSPPMNLVQARATAHKGGVLLRFAKTDITLLAPRPNPVIADQDILFGIRPEHISPSEAPAQAELMVVETELAGSDQFVTTDLAGQRLMVRAPASLPLAPQTPRVFGFDMETACYFSPISGKRL